MSCSEQQKIQDSHIRQFKCTGPSKWLVEEWFRVSVSVRVRARAREYSFFFRRFFFAVGLFLSCFFFVCFFCCFLLFFGEKSFDVTSVLNMTSRVLYFCY